MLKKASFWAAIAAVALVGLSLSGGSVAFADPPCPAGVNPPCPPGKGGTPPAGASGQAQNAQNENGEGRHGAFGVVKNKDENSFDLMTKQGSLPITYSSDTKCKSPGPGGSDDCADVVVNGNYVSVQGTPEDGGIAANRIQLNRGRSLHEHCRGEIVSITETSLVVDCRTDADGGVFRRTFALDSTKFGPKGEGIEDWDDLGPEDEVAVVASRDGLGGDYTAKVVHKVAD